MIADDVLIRRTEVVRIHLDILEAVLSEQPGESQAIRASISLRFLMDGALNRVANDIGEALRIPSPDLDGVPIDQALVFACGGYTIGGIAFAPYYGYRMPGPASPYRWQFDRQAAASPREHSLVEAKLGTFLQSPCLGILGKLFSRDIVIRYVANKCGGAHHHDDTVRFDAIEHGVTNVGQGLGMNGDGLSAVFLETLGSAYFLLAAPGTSRLREALAGRS